MLQQGDTFPHVDVRTTDGATFSYASIWQRKGLVLVAMPGAAPAAAEYARDMQAQQAALSAADAVGVVTEDPIPGLDDGGVIVADRWGEIVYVAPGPGAASQHSPADLVEWARHVQGRCPECEGEAK